MAIRRVLIVGAGLGGLTLAAAIRKLGCGLEVQILERDSGPYIRAQGYSIGLRSDAGLGALRDLGFWSDIQQWGDASRVFRMITPNGRVLVAFEPQNENSPYFTVFIRRSRLRDLLMERCGAPIIWSARAVSYREQTSAASVLCADGREFEADFVVAADGAGSRLRLEMNDDPPRFAGVGIVHGTSASRHRHPLLADSSFITLGPGTSAYLQNTEGRIAWSVGISAPGPKTFSEWTPEMLLAEVLGRVEKWHEPIAEVVRSTHANEVTVRDAYDRAPPRAMVRGRLALLGDAAHPMTPYQGQGANLAIRDGLDLASALIGQDSATGLSEYDRQATRRAKSAVESSKKAAKSFHLTSASKAWCRDTRLRALHAGLRLATLNNDGATVSASRPSTK